MAARVSPDIPAAMRGGWLASCRSGYRGCLREVFLARNGNFRRRSLNQGAGLFCSRARELARRLFDLVAGVFPFVALQHIPFDDFGGRNRA